MVLATSVSPVVHFVRSIYLSLLICLVQRLFIDGGLDGQMYEAAILSQSLFFHFLIPQLMFQAGGPSLDNSFFTRRSKLAPLLGACQMLCTQGSGSLPSVWADDIESSGNGCESSFISLRKLRNQHPSFLSFPSSTMYPS